MKPPSSSSALVAEPLTPLPLVAACVCLVSKYALPAKTGSCTGCSCTCSTAFCACTVSSCAKAATGTCSCGCSWGRLSSSSSVSLPCCSLLLPCCSVSLACCSLLLACCSASLSCTTASACDASTWPIAGVSAWCRLLPVLCSSSSVCCGSSSGVFVDVSLPPIGTSIVATGVATRCCSLTIVTSATAPSTSSIWVSSPVGWWVCVVKGLLPSACDGVSIVSLCSSASSAARVATPCCNRFAISSLSWFNDSVVLSSRFCIVFN